MLTYALDYIWYNLQTNEEWQNRAKWTGNAFIYASAIAMSLSTELRNFPIIYYSFMVGHLIWGTVGVALKDKPLIMLNYGFVPLDINAIAICP